jgi:hypothetical protein
MKTDTACFHGLKDRHRGERVVLVADGPSLNVRDYPLTRNRSESDE